MVSNKWWKKYRLTSERNFRKNAQNNKIIINTIYMKPCFPIIKKIVRKLWCKCTLKFYTICFMVCQVEGYRNLLKLSCRPIAFTSLKASFFKKKRSGTSLPASFPVWFLKKNTSLAIYYINWQNLIVWLPVLREIFGNICILIFY